mmetsp:Transcript_19860/g.55251  ORF Transcript_19860/g.55251 Transcript_19860/m.55251 type:complete len:252 (-) Transcript_19860:62-817(-)
MPVPPQVPRVLGSPDAQAAPQKLCNSSASWVCTQRAALSESVQTLMLLSSTVKVVPSSSDDSVVAFQLANLCQATAFLIKLPEGRSKLSTFTVYRNEPVRSLDAWCEAPHLFRVAEGQDALQSLLVGVVLHNLYLVVLSQCKGPYKPTRAARLCYLGSQRPGLKLKAVSYRVLCHAFLSSSSGHSVCMLLQTYDVLLVRDTSSTYPPRNSGKSESSVSFCPASMESPWVPGPGCLDPPACARACGSDIFTV